MDRELGLILYSAGDLEASKKFFRTLLGVDPYADAPYYVGFRPGGVEIGLTPSAAGRPNDGPIAYWSTHDLEASVDELVNAGATVRQPITDVGGGMRIAVLQDANGNAIGLRSAGNAQANLD